jgi:hypothetical protein
VGIAQSRPLTLSVNAMKEWSHTYIPPTCIHAYQAPNPTTIISKYTPISPTNDPSIILTLSETKNPQQTLGASERIIRGQHGGAARE